jgi:hypothetical protein
VRQSMDALVLARQIRRADLVFDLVERADVAQRLGGQLRLSTLRLEECPPGMGPSTARA